MVKCRRCGYENYSDSVYCENCMYPLKSQKEMNKPKRNNDSGWNISTFKKVIIVIGIIFLAYLSFSIIYEVSQPSPENSLNVITTNSSSNQQSSTRPYQVNIIYNGSWTGEMGKSDSLVDKSGTGDDLIKLTCAGWDNVTVKITKVDYNSEPLTVQLLKNGKVIRENTTTTPHGEVEINI